MKNRLSSALLFLVFTVSLTACGTKSAQDIVSKALAVDASSGREVLNYDTHSGNGDGTSCLVLNFEDHTVLEEIKENTEWKAFPLDETVQTLVYGVENGTRKIGPFLTGENGKPLVPEIQNGYYLLINRQAKNGIAAGADILHRGSFNFSLGLYDTDTNTLYFCQLDT